MFIIYHKRYNDYYIFIKNTAFLILNFKKYKFEIRKNGCYPRVGKASITKFASFSLKESQKKYSIMRKSIIQIIGNG